MNIPGRSLNLNLYWQNHLRILVIINTFLYIFRMLDAQKFKVSILVVPQSSMMTLAAVVDPLRAANRLAREHIYDWNIYSLDGQSVMLTSGIDIAVAGEFSAEDTGDALLVIAGFNHTHWASAKYLSRLAAAARRFNTICGIEAGTWLLAKAGIVTDHRVTTHWEDVDALRAAFPNLQVRRDRYTIDRKIWTSGGAVPSLDMMLQYIRTSQNQSLAQDIASVFIYHDSLPASDAQLSAASARYVLSEPRLATALAIMAANIEEPLSIAQIHQALGVSIKTLENLFVKHLSVTPKTYYLRLRLQAARKLILASALSITDVGLQSGFNSPTDFSRAFKRHFGVTPSALRRQSA